MIDPAFFILQESKLKRFLAIFREGNWAKILVMAAFLLIFLALSGGVFLFSLSTFKLLGQYSYVGQPIIVYTLATTFILTSVLTLGSSVITSLRTLFQREDNQLLFSFPLEAATIFESRLVDIIFLSSWPLFAFALPLVLGYRLGLGLDSFPTFLFLAGVLFLILLANLLGVAVALLISRLWGNLEDKILGVFLLIALPLLAKGLIELLLPPQLLTSLGAFSVEEITHLVSRQALMARFLPTTWLVNLICSWSQNPLVGIRSLVLLALSFLVVLLSLLSLRGRFYLMTVSKTAEGRFIAAPRDAVRKTTRPFPYLLKGKIGALTEKDWLVIYRSPSQLFQLGLIVFLGIVYFLVMARVPLERVQQTFPGWHQEKLAKVNFLFINGLASVLAMRFSFPMISLEGQSSWVVWSAPLARIRIFWQKLIPSFLVILSGVAISTLVSTRMLALPLLYCWPLVLASVPLTLTITFITLGIGAIKPNFWEKDPEKLSTSPGGVIATAVCLGYLATAGALLLFPKRGVVPTLLVHLLLWLISGLIIAPILALVSQKINKYEM